jgi:hypothetical protein
MYILPPPDDFMRTYYTLFDGGEMRIGFACDAKTCRGGSHQNVQGRVREVSSEWRNMILVGICFAVAAFGFYGLWVAEHWKVLLDVGFGGVCVDDGFTAVSSTLDYGLELQTFSVPSAVEEGDGSSLQASGYQDREYDNEDYQDIPSPVRVRERQQSIEEGF